MRRKGSVLYYPPLEPASGALQFAEQLGRLACGLAERNSSRAGQRRGSGWLREFREMSSRTISRIRLRRAAQEARSMKSWDSLAS